MFSIWLCINIPRKFIPMEIIVMFCDYLYFISMICLFIFPICTYDTDGNMLKFFFMQFIEVLNTESFV